VALLRPAPSRRAGLAAAAALALGLAGAPAAVGAAPAGEAPAAPAAVAAYAPLVVLHPAERYWPLAAEVFVRRSALLFAHDRGCPDRQLAGAGAVDPARLAGGGYRARAASERCVETGRLFRSDEHTRPFDSARLAPSGGEGFTLDLAGAARTGTPSSSVEPGLYTGTAVYYSYVPERFVTYWFSYGFSVPSFVASSLAGHEGDWEHVTVALRSGDEPTHVAYFFHNQPPELVAWSAVRKEAVTHPVVYSALGSHGSYRSAGLQGRVCLRTALRSFCGRDATGEGLRWRSWEDLRDLCSEPWYGAWGAWGAVGVLGGLTTGSLPPSPYREHAPSSIRRGATPC